MSIKKEAMLHLSLEEKRQLAFDLLDSIDEEYIEKPLPEWKIQLIKQRVDTDIAYPADTMEWNKLRNKYFDQ